MALPDTSMFKGDGSDTLEKYMAIFKTIGGTVYLVDTIAAVKELMNKNFDVSKRIVTTLPELSDVAEVISAAVDPHSYEDVELAVIKAAFGVAENGALWITEDLMGQRIIPYICQHLAVIERDHAIGHPVHQRHVVLDHQHGDAELGLHVAEIGRAHV